MKIKKYVSAMRRAKDLSYSTSAIELRLQRMGVVRYEHTP